MGVWVPLFQFKIPRIMRVGAISFLNWVDPGGPNSLPKFGWTRVEVNFVLKFND